MRTAGLHEIYQKYGFIIRIAPSIIRRSAGHQLIYSERTPYNFFADCTWAALIFLMEEIGKRTKSAGSCSCHAFARFSTDDAEPLIADQVRKLLAWVEKKEGSAVDVYAWFHMLVLDTTAPLFMGEEIGAVDDDAPHEHHSNLDNHLKICCVKW